MDMDKILEQMRDMILGELKQEFAHFRESVTEELSGFRVAIESISARQSSMENDLREIRKSIADTNKRINGLKSDLLRCRNDIRAEFNHNTSHHTERIDKVNDRIDSIHYEAVKPGGYLRESVLQQEAADDLIVRVKRLEGQAA